jgi:subtilisin family serine protease
VAAALPHAAAAAAQGAGPAVPDRTPAEGVLVRFADGAAAGERAAARRRADVTRETRLPVDGLELVEPGASTTVAEAVRDLERQPDVLYAEPDVPRVATAQPDDPLFGHQWALRNVGQDVGGAAGPADLDIAALSAWDVVTGDAAVAVAIVDSGIDLDHPDLAANVWRNPGESGGREANGVDDDGNGRVDDVRGWDFVQDDAEPADANGHGTHVAGTVAAGGNDGRGVAGVAWRASLMPVRVLDAEGSGSVSDVVGGYAYAARSGARIVNASLGGTRYSRAEYDAIAAAPETLFVVAAGNEAADNDAAGAYPCNYGLDNVICVAASDREDSLAGFSNYGATTVDLAAPGVDIASTWVGDDWALLNGTSMATPHVAGVAALLLARDRSTSTRAMRGALLAGVDAVPSLRGRVATGGRLDATRALQAGGAPLPSPSAPPPAPAPAPAPAPGQAPAPRGDVDPPGISVSLRSGRLATVARRGLPVRVRCSEACRALVDARVDARTVRRLRLSRRPGPLRLAVARVTVPRGRSGLARLRLMPRARAAVRRQRRVEIVLRFAATDAAGNTRRTARRVTLRR